MGPKRAFLAAILLCATGIFQPARATVIHYITVNLPENLLRMDPQESAGTIVRFTAPAASSNYSVTGYFQGIDTSQYDTYLNVYVGATSQWNDVMPIGGYGTQKSFNLTGLTLAAGQTVDFIVVKKTLRVYLSVGLRVVISDGAGHSYDVTANFNPTNSASGVFTYGAGGTPAAFSLMTNVYTANCVGLTTGATCIDNGQPPYQTSAVTFNGTAAQTPATVPALSEWGLIGLGLLLVILALRVVRSSPHHT